MKNYHIAYNFVKKLFALQTFETNRNFIYNIDNILMRLTYIELDAKKEVNNICQWTFS